MYAILPTEVCVMIQVFGYTHELTYKVKYYSLSSSQKTLYSLSDESYIEHPLTSLLRNRRLQAFSIRKTLPLNSPCWQS